MMRKAKTAHRRSLASRPAPLPCWHQWAVAGIFWRLDKISFAIFAHVYFTTSDNFLNNILCVLWWDRQKLSPQKEFGILPHTTALPTSMGTAGIFWRLDLISFAIFAHVYFTTSDKFFNNILCVSWCDRWKLSPQKEFGILPHSTTLPT